MGEQQDEGQLHRHFGVVQATALNVTMIIGAGVFITIPEMLRTVPGPYALLGWVLAGALILIDGLIWSELGAALPGSGGSALYLQESYGRDRWGRLMAFLFIWQFLISGPLELASGLIAMDTFSRSLSPAWAEFNRAHTWPIPLWEAQGFGLTLSPGRLAVVGVGVLILALLYRRVTTLGRLTVVLWVGVLSVLAWICIEGALRFDPAVAFDFSGRAAQPENLSYHLGSAMRLALYSYLGYYQICYMGDEVRDPGRTIPRAVLLSAGLVVVLFCLTHLAMLGTVSWQEVPTKTEALESYSLPAEFMRRAHGEWAARLITVFLLGSCFASAFSGLLGYSRIPYGAARQGYFFRVFGRVHPSLHIPHVSLLLVGGMMLFWSFFGLGDVINALITTRIVEQFLAQAVGVVLLRQARPDLPRPFRVWLYPLPVIVAVVAWGYLYLTSGLPFITLGLGTLVAGKVAFLLWSWRTGGWPFVPVRRA